MTGPDLRVAGADAGDCALRFTVGRKLKMGGDGPGEMMLVFLRYFRFVIAPVLRMNGDDADNCRPKFVVGPDLVASDDIEIFGFGANLRVAAASNGGARFVAAPDVRATGDRAGCRGTRVEAASGLITSSGGTGNRETRLVVAPDLRTSSLRKPFVCVSGKLNGSPGPSKLRLRTRTASFCSKNLRQRPCMSFRKRLCACISGTRMFSIIALIVFSFKAPTSAYIHMRFSNCYSNKKTRATTKK